MLLSLTIKAITVKETTCSAIMDILIPLCLPHHHVLPWPSTQFTPILSWEASE